MVILAERGILQRLASSPDGDRAQQQPPERGTEGGIPSFDRVLCVTQQMGEAHLPTEAMAALAAQHVGDPHRRADRGEQGAPPPCHGWVGSRAAPPAWPRTPIPSRSCL
jgi:hypothetical protein